MASQQTPAARSSQHALSTVLEEHVDAEREIGRCARAQLIDKVGVRGTQRLGHGAVLADLQAVEIDECQQFRWQVPAQKVLGDLAAREALAKVDVMRIVDLVHDVPRCVQPCLGDYRPVIQSGNMRDVSAVRRGTEDRPQFIVVRPWFDGGPCQRHGLDLGWRFSRCDQRGRHGTR